MLHMWLRTALHLLGTECCCEFSGFHKTGQLGNEQVLKKAPRYKLLGWFALLQRLIPLICLLFKWEAVCGQLYEKLHTNIENSSCNFNFIISNIYWVSRKANFREVPILYLHITRFRGAKFQFLHNVVKFTACANLSCSFRRRPNQQACGTSHQHTAPSNLSSSPRTASATWRPSGLLHHSMY